MTLIWFFISLAGIVVAAFSLLDAISDFRGLGEIRNGRRIMAKREMRVEFGRLVIQGGFAFLGGLAIYLGEYGEVNVGTLILVGANAILLTNSVLDLRDRLRLRRLIA
jgi:hypothetical protein